MKKKISLLLALIMVFSVILTACGSNDANVGDTSDKGNGTQVENGGNGQLTVQDIKDKGTIVLGTSADYPPFEFHAMINGKDEIVGFDIELAKYIADELGVELEIRDMDFDKLLGALATGMVDMVIAGMNPDPEREANFTDIYYEANLAVLIHKDNADKITKMEDLEGKSIGVQIGTIQEEVAKEEIKDAEVKSLGTNPDIVMNLMTNKIDCAIMETPVAESYAQVNEDIIVVEGLNFDIDSGGVAIAVKKGNDELTEKLNEIIAAAKEEGLLEKWFVEANELVNESL
ncbi:MAG: transporter substrate-binding domain-containing protein [Tissierellia bacterium]|nr:transporter substrate-binding domain-containing protein [Tissierellia bacterium]